MGEPTGPIGTRDGAAVAEAMEKEPIVLQTGDSPATEAPRVPLLASLTDGARVPLPELDPAVPSPAEFFGEPLGETFHRHDELLRYLEALAAASPRVVMGTYGESYEGRPLTLLAVSSPANIRRLQDIRRRHMRLAQSARLGRDEREALVYTQPVLVWMGYGVHGNESSSSEAALAAAYVLAAAQGEWEELLEEVVVLIDPLSNPDGRDRYVQAYQSRRGLTPDPDPAAYEHLEPWPGGRYNHYFFDLNRDWAWLTQQETRLRVAAYRMWEPQVHVDFHEMQPTSTYFFPPGADPVHPAIDPSVISGIADFGRANARAFDELGWIFFNRQDYDLFYPGYGDSYPSLRGAVGMTYEMAGGGRAGTVIALPGRPDLSLADRVARHLVTSMATVETAARNRPELLKAFAANRLAAATHLPQSIVWEADQPEARALAELLVEHGIEVGRLTADVPLSVSPGIGGTQEQRLFEAGGFSVSTAQPLAGLVEALMKVSSPLPEEFEEQQRRRVEASLRAEFYDITAWALPTAFNVNTWVVYGEPPAVAPWRPEADGGVVGKGDLGYLVPPQGVAGYRFAAWLGREGIHHRLALAELTTGGHEFPRGTLFIPVRTSPAESSGGQNLAERIEARARQDGVTLHRTGSSVTEKGVSLGSNDLVPIRGVRVALAMGEGTYPSSAGALWYLFDRAVETPYTAMDLSDVPERLGRRVGGAESGAFDVLVLPDGRGYGRELGARGAEALAEWVRAGGVLVAIEGAAEWVIEQELFSVGTGLGGGEEMELEEEEGPMPALDVPGAVVATDLREHHPLTAGLPSPPPFLFNGDDFLPPTGQPDRDLVTVAMDEPVIAGLAWPEARERLPGALLVGESRLGRGRVIVFAQDPAFRMFWRGTMPLLLNAVLYGPSW